MGQPMHQNLLVRSLAAIAALVLTAVVLLVGAVAFLLFLGLAVIAFVVFRARLWWMRRRVAGKGQSGGPGAAGSGKGSTSSGPGRVIEGEYRRTPDDRTD